MWFSWTMAIVVLGGALFIGWAKDRQWRYDVAQRLAKAQALVDHKKAELAKVQNELSEKLNSLDYIQERDAAVFALRDSANHVFARLDHEGRVKEWNPAAERLSGWKEHEMIGQTLQRVMTPESWAKHEPAYLKFIAQPVSVGQMVIVRCTIIHRTTGAETPVRMNVRAIKSRNMKNPEAIALGDVENRVIERTNDD